MSDNYIEHEIDGRGKLALRFMPDDCRLLLDAGCSHGYSTKIFAQKAQKTIAIDIDKDSIAIATERYPHIEFHATSLDTIPLPPCSVDCIICTDVMEHVDDEVASLNEFYRVMKVGATAIITTPHAGLFQWLDSYNFQYHLRKNAYPLYSFIHKFLRGKPPTKESPHLSEFHRHYTLNDFSTLLAQSDFCDSYEFVHVHRGGFIFDPLSYLIAHASSFFFTKLPIPIYYLCRMFHREFDISFGSLAYNIGVVIRKTQ